MPEHDFIKSQPHFKIEISFRDMLIFESALAEGNISFYREENPVLLSGNITYFIADANRKATDMAIKSNKLDAGTQTIRTSDYIGMKKMYQIYCIVALTLIILFAACA